MTCRDAEMRYSCPCAAKSEYHQPWPAAPWQNFTACAVVAGFGGDDLAGLSSGSRGPNWWHVMMGVTIPLSVALLEAGLPRRAYLVKPPVSASLLAKQLALLPSVRLVDANRTVTHRLRRCDTSVSKFSPHARARGAANYGFRTRTRR